MEQKIINKLTSNFDNIPISKESFKPLHELTNNEFEPTTDIEILYVAFYWELKNDHDKMVKYCLMACANKNITAAIQLGCHYYNILNFKEAIKYYFLALAYQSSKVMNCHVQISNIDDMVKYCPMPFANNHNPIMCALGYCYSELSEIENAIKCVLLGIEKGYFVSKNNLAYIMKICPNLTMLSNII